MIDNQKISTKTKGKYNKKKASESLSPSHERDSDLVGSSNSMIFPEYIGHKISVYNGQTYRGIKIDEDKVGLKLGEFIFTKKRAIYKRKKNKGKNKQGGNKQPQISKSLKKR